MLTPDDISKLLASIALHDRTAFDTLYQHTSAKLFGVVLRLLKDRAEAEDALQDIYVKVWQRADQYAVSRASAMSWLIAIARNHAIDRLRTRRAIYEELDEAKFIADDTPDPEALAQASGERTRIEICMQRLEDRLANAVRGAYLDGYSYQELANQHAVPLNTMRTWLRRSLMKLRKCLEE